MTERQLQDAVLKLARLQGWLVYHTYDSRRSQPGFPDLVMVRKGQLLFVELKGAKGKLAREQREWIGALACVMEDTFAMDVYVWKPKDWLDGTIEEVLR